MSLSYTYIRCKRKNQTIFLYVEPQSDTVKEIKKKIVAILKEGSADNIRLIYGESILDDSRTFADYKIDNDHVVYWVSKKDGVEDWEPVDIQKYEAPVEVKEEKAEKK